MSCGKGPTLVSSSPDQLSSATALPALKNPPGVRDLDLESTIILFGLEGKELLEVSPLTPATMCFHGMLEIPPVFPWALLGPS